MKKQSPTIFSRMFSVFLTSPAVVLKILFVGVVLFAAVLWLWALGLIGVGGRDIIEPQRTVRLHNQSVQIVNMFLEDREDQMNTILAERYVNPFR